MNIEPNHIALRNTVSLFLGALRCWRRDAPRTGYRALRTSTSSEEIRSLSLQFSTAVRWPSSRCIQAAGPVGHRTRLYGRQWMSIWPNGATTAAASRSLPFLSQPAGASPRVTARSACRYRRQGSQSPSGRAVGHRAVDRPRRGLDHITAASERRRPAIPR